MKPKLSISFSGGRSSALMTKIALEKYGSSHDIIITFANTGAEHPATLDFVHECETRFGWPIVWLEAVVHEGRKGVTHRVVTYETASRNCEPYEAYIAKYGIPNPTSMSCTLRLKVDPMDSYRKSLGWVRGKNLNYYTAIGIRYDELDRMSSQAEKQKLIYPLVDEKITKDMVTKFWKSQPFDLRIPGDHYGNCVFCFKKSDRKLFTLAIESPNFFEFPRRMDQKYGTFKLESKSSKDGRRTFYRGYRSTDQIIDEAWEALESGKFIPYRDKLPEFDQHLDKAGACGESCEVYTDGPDVDPDEWEKMWWSEE